MAEIKRYTSAYADDVNILGGSVHTVKENAEALVVVSIETGQEVNADKSMYSTWSCVKIRMQDEVRLIIVPLKGWKSSNIWEQP